MDGDNMSKKHKDKITDLINDTLNWNFLKTSIQNERAMIAKYAPVDFPEDYDDYSFYDYLILYKINRLYELKIISEQEQKLLIELYNIRLKLIEKECDLVSDDFDREIHIHDKEREIVKAQIKIINDRFLKYNMVLTDGPFSEIEIQNIIERIIATEDYSNKPNTEELESLVKDLKKRSSQY